LPRVCKRTATAGQSQIVVKQKKRNERQETQEYDDLNQKRRNKEIMLILLLQT
jgi:hypothetical protein